VNKNKISQDFLDFCSNPLLLINLGQNLPSNNPLYAQTLQTSEHYLSLSDHKILRSDFEILDCHITETVKKFLLLLEK
jgi:hypothetical protein